MAIYIEHLALHLLQECSKRTLSSQLDFEWRHGGKAAPHGLDGGMQWEATIVHDSYRKVTRSMVHRPDFGKHT